jgi:peptidoglycan/LPS O-acetylase OafA/YrhL
LNGRLLSHLRPGAFRLFLAVAVVISHSSRFDLGDWAVYTFFILSGYWIHRMWTQKYSRARRPYLVFICSRIVRILPIFWLANLICALVIVWTDAQFPGPVWGWIPAAASNVLLLGYANLPFAQGGLRVAWTLDVEMQFYIFFPFLLYLCTRRPGGMLWGLLITVLSVAGLVLFMTPAGIGARHLGCYGLFFLIGAAAAQREWKPEGRWAARTLLLMAAVVIVCWNIPHLRHLVQNAKHGATDTDIHFKRITQAVLAVVTAPAALFSVRNSSDARDRALGEFTYVLYLVHWPIMMLHSYYFVHLAPLQRLPSILGAWVVVAAASLAVYRYIDQPIERMRKRWVASQVGA